MFLKLKYPKRFHASQDQNKNGIEPDDSPALIILPFKDQKSADSVYRQLSDLGKKIDRVIQLVFISRKISEDLKVTENQQCVVYEFKCNSCDAFTSTYASRSTKIPLSINISRTNTIENRTMIFFSNLPS